MNINLKVWRQKNREEKGEFKAYRLQDIDPNISFLEMLDILNNKLIKQKIEPVAFDHDCREGICGSCGFMINGQPHGPQKATTVCQLHMRSFNSEDEIVLEPFRAFLLTLEVRKKQMQRLLKKQMLTKPFFLRPVLVAGHVLLPAKILQQCFLQRPKFHTLLCCHRESLTKKKEFKKWWQQWTKKGLGHVQIPAPVQLSVPKKFHKKTLLD